MPMTRISAVVSISVVRVIVKCSYGLVRKKSNQTAVEIAAYVKSLHLEDLALALGRALGPVVLDRSMSRKAKSTQARDELEARIGYAFADKAILDRALTHISATSPKQGRRTCRSLSPACQASR